MKCLLVTLLGMVSLVRGEPAASVPKDADPSSLPAGLNVLVIGDSNTEIGHITGGLARRFEEKFGYFGSGYRSLSAIVGVGAGYLPYLKISHDTGWEPYAMVGGPAPVAKPFLSPDGTGLMGRAAGLTANVEFYGNAIDIFSLDGLPSGGSFSANVDGKPPLEIKTASGDLTVKKTTMSGLVDGWHTLQLKTWSATPVLLLGVNARQESKPPTPEAIVHKWGKGWATTADFGDIDEEVFTSAVRELTPDVTVVLLGTNDHNLAGHNRDQFADNLRVIVNRLRVGAPQTRIMIASTIQVNSGWSNSGLAEYRGVLPELCNELGVSYWDMSDRFGTYADAKAAGEMMDDVHVNEKGGDRIAGMLFDEVLRVAEKTAPVPAGQPGTSRRVGSPSLWTATGVPGLIGWWSAAGPVSHTGNQRATLVPDQSGTNNHAMAPWEASAPEIVMEAGLPLLRFDGAQNHLRFSSMMKVWTVVLLARINSPIFGHPYFNTRPFHWSVTKPAKALSTQYASEAVIKGKAFLNGRPVELGDHDDSTLELGGEDFQLLAMVFRDPVEIGYFGWGGSWNFDHYVKGELAELLFFDRALTDIELRGIEEDLLARWPGLPGLGIDDHAMAQ